MKKLKKTLLVLFSLLALFALAIIIYFYSLRPKYEGETPLQNISKDTEVYFDEYGVPHIYATSQKDAMVALGYVHAQERLWQMELMRRIAPGRLSELFGSKTLKNDKFFASLGIDENSQKAVDLLDKNSQEYVMASAYLDGVNQYLHQGKTPVEFTLLGIKKQDFTLKDIYNIFGFMSFSFAMAQKTDPLLTDIKNSLGDPYLQDFGLSGTLNTTQIKNFQGKEIEYSKIAQSITAMLENQPLPPFIGSNSWVIGAEKTKNGKVIFANDPHIGFSQPCTWFEAHISCPDYEIYGYYLAGTPFPLLGHNRKMAYGLTMFENDDIDFFSEKINPKKPSEYYVNNKVNTLETKNLSIHVKDSASVLLHVKKTIHGVIINDVLDAVTSSQPISMSWIYTSEPNNILKAVYALSHATNYKQYKKGVELIHAPGLNIMYGDALGNIAWTTAGKLYKMPENVNPNFILNGSNGIDDKKEFLDFSKNPQALNPSWHYVYSANNQPEAVDGYLYPGYYLPKDRATRIDYLLQQKNNWTSTDVQKMIVDNTSATVSKTIKEMLSKVSVKNQSKNFQIAYNTLSHWQGNNDLNETAPTIYNKWLYFYLKNTFKDELGEEKFNVLMGTHVIKQVLTTQCLNPNSVWWDNTSTKNKVETQSDILTLSLQQAIASLEKQLNSNPNEWTWNKVHKLEHIHPVGKVKILAPLFNVGTFEVAGSNEVINNLLFALTDEKQYTVKAGPSTRRIIDFSDVENAVSILPTGQSGVPLSAHYSDQAKMYNEGQFRKMKLNKKEIIATSTKLIFKAK